MSRKDPGTRRNEALARIDRLRERVAALDLVCSGTLLRRTKVCGKPTCRCAADPEARHGPYYEWGWMKRGRLVHRMVSAEQAALLRKAIGNHRALRRIIRAWETETVKIMNAQDGHN